MRDRETNGDEREANLTTIDVKIPAILGRCALAHNPKEPEDVKKTGCAHDATRKDEHPHRRMPHCPDAHHGSAPEAN